MERRSSAFSRSDSRSSDKDDLRLGDSPLTCARSIPFSAASFLASGLANTRPFLGAAGAAAAGPGAAAAAGAAAWKEHQTSVNTVVPGQAILKSE